MKAIKTSSNQTLQSWDLWFIFQSNITLEPVALWTTLCSKY